MQLTQYSDYALRILLYLGIHPPEEGQKPPALLDISRAYGISFSHLSKVAQQLAQRTHRRDRAGVVLGVEALDEVEVRLGGAHDLAEVDLGGGAREPDAAGATALGDDEAALR